MAYPNDYDSVDSLIAPPTDIAVLSVSAVNLVGSDWVFTVSGPSVAAGSILSYTHPSAAGAVEIVKVVSRVGASLTVLRQQEGTSLLGWSSGAILVQEMTSGLYQAVQDLVLRTQKFLGLVGSTLPGTCQPGELFFRTTDLTIHACFVTNVWERIDNPDHGNMTGLTADDAHAIYFTLSALTSWHSALAGQHVTNPSTHNHLTAPIRRIRNGAAANIPTPQNTGDVYLATDTKTLYFSKDGAAWKAYSTIPRGSIVMFETACPPGWTRVSSMDGRFPKGAPTGTWSGLIQGGTSSHDHTLPTLIAHTHSISATALVVNTTGDHYHDLPVYSGSGSNYVAFDPGTAGSTGNINSGSNGSHSHTVTVPSRDSTQVGTSAPKTQAQGNLPPFYEILFCVKD